MKQRVYVLLVLMALAVILSAIGALILTDAGQIFGISKGVVVGYFNVHGVVMGLAAGFMLAALLVNRRWQVLRRWQTALFVLVVVGCLVATKFATPYVLFPARQHSTVYKKHTEMSDYLDANDVVYVIEHNGVVRAFAQKFIWQPHILGGDYGGDDIVLTYCVLTNLPVPYENDLNGQPMELRVLAQTNNNLLLWEQNSGEIIQQITSTCELSKEQLDPIPVLQMSWDAYRDIYPEGWVAHVEFNRPLEKILHFLMPLEDAHAGDNWMFKTVDFSDERLHSKEKIIGVVDGDHAVAYTHDYLAKAGVTNVSVGGKRLVFAHIPEHDVIVAFDRMQDGVELTVEDVDFFGNTEAHGQLERAFFFNGPMWAVWRHYYPQTDLMQ